MRSTFDLSCAFLSICLSKGVCTFFFWSVILVIVNSIDISPSIILSSAIINDLFFMIQ